MEASKSFFFRHFWVFQVFARRFFLDFRGLGPPPGLIFELFLRHAFFARFFGYFWQKIAKMKKVKTAQNTAPVHRIWLSRVWKNHTQHRKKHIQIFIDFWINFGFKCKEKAKRNRKGTKIPFGTVFGDAFLAIGPIFVDLAGFQK